MASHALTARFRRPMMAWSALFKAELLTLSKSWVLRGWVIALALTEFFILTGMLAAGRVQAVPASAILAAHLNGFLLVWSLVIIVLGAGSVSMESDVIADSILSRSCTRTQYIAAKLAARALAVLAVFLVSSIIAGVAAYRYAANDMTISTLATGIMIEGLAVLLLLSIGIALSVIANNTIFAIVGALLLWYVAAPIFSFMGADYLSPTSLTRNLPRILKDPAQLQLVQASPAPTSLTLQFSKPLEPAKAEDIGNYLVEVGGQPAAVKAAVYDRNRTSVILQGLDLSPGASVKVTARNVTDSGGGEISPAADSATVTVPGEALVAGTAAEPDGTAALQPRAKPSAANPGDRTPPRVERCTVTPSSLTVYFSKEMDPKEAEATENYLIENPPGTRQAARTATYTASTRSVLLSGLSLSTSDGVKVTAVNARDRSGNPISKRGNSAIYSDVTTWKYVLGFGLPTVAAFLVAIIWFSKRDL